jgi:hypothetical protein
VRCAGFGFSTQSWDQHFNVPHPFPCLPSSITRGALQVPLLSQLRVLARAAPGAEAGRRNFTPEPAHVKVLIVWN